MILNPMKWKGYRIAAWLGIGLLGFAVLLEAVVGLPHQALLLSIFLILAVFLVLQGDERLPPIFSFLFVFSSILNAAGWVWDLFQTVSIYDEFTHAFTTFTAAAALGCLIFRTMRAVFLEQRGLFSVAIMNLGVTLEVIWEYVEWFLGVINSLEDTLIDLAMDGLGAAVAGYFVIRILSSTAHTTTRRSLDSSDLKAG